MNTQTTQAAAQANGLNSWPHPPKGTVPCQCGAPLMHIHTTKAVALAPTLTRPHLPGRAFLPQGGMALMEVHTTKTVAEGPNLNGRGRRP